MRYLTIFIMLLGAASCTKTKTNVSNIPIANNSGQPAFVIHGLSDVTITNYFTMGASLQLDIIYEDSAQERVSLSLSGLPDGITVDTTQMHGGIPTYSFQINLYDTGAGVAPGIYPLTLTATTPSGKIKNWGFNLKALSITSYLGKYNDCSYNCGAILYTDSVYADATVRNKIWFTNYANSGGPVYGLLRGGSGLVEIPVQTVGGHTYSGSGGVSGHGIIVNTSTSCQINMQ